MTEQEKRLRSLTGYRVLVLFSIALPYYLYRITAYIDGLATGEAGPGVEPAPTTGILWQILELLSPVASAQDPTGRAVQGLVAIISVQTLLYIGLGRLLRRHIRVHVYIQLAGDLLSASFLVYQLGNSYSIVYLIVLSVSSVMLRRSEVLVIAAVAFLLYAGLQLGLSYGWLERMPWRALGLPPPRSTELVGIPLTNNLAMHGLGFFAVAFLTSLLSRNVAQARRELAANRHDLAHLQVLHRDVIQSISSGLITTDLDGRITSLNRAGAEILGLREEEVVGLEIRETPLFTETLWRQWQERPSSPGNPLRSETRLERGDHMAHIGFSLMPLSDIEGAVRGHILNFQDFTDRRRLEEALRTRDRMAALGEMAAGLAHEVGNPLAAISGSVQMLSRSHQGNPSERKLLEITLKESQRLDRTVKRFLNFARPREPQPVPFDVAQMLHDAVALLANSAELGPQHHIAAELLPRHAVIVADPDLLKQIFWNLARNALRAMPEGGTLRVVGRLLESRYRIEFHDTGSGMSEEERANLFHPFKSFFDEGTGLGMAIVYRIVEEHGGEIGVSSEPGRGSSIIVDLPLVEVERAQPSNPISSEATTS